MSKKPKQKQTEWNIQGRDIANTAVPYYKTNLGRIDNYLSNPMARMDEYINKYYDNTVEQSDFLRNYNRAMAGLTGHNYAATGGGYDTSNQRLYDDSQRYANDLAARLRDKGIISGRNMAQQDYANMLAANEYYDAAYRLGQPYSNVDQYNYQVKQYNSLGNQLLGLAGGAGKVFSSIPLPRTQAVGAGLQTVGQFALDDNAFNASTGTNMTDMANSIISGLGRTSQFGGDNWVTRLTGRNYTPTSNQSLRMTAPEVSTMAGQFMNPKQQATNYFSNNTRLNSIPNSTLMENMRKRGLING